MRPHSRYSVDRNFPSAKGVCNRCGFMYQLHTLRWQYEWQGPKLQNQHFLVCDTCYDKPQEQFRVIILPADPVPVFNPRQENYTQDDNPISTIGVPVGDMTGYAGLAGAFSMGTNKPYIMGAGKSLSTVGYNNSVGKNWGTGNTQTMSEFSLYAPNNAPFLAAGSAYKIQGSPAGAGIVFIDIYSSTIAGTIGEIITVPITNAIPYQYHRVVFNGDGLNKVCVAQFVINSANQQPQGDT